MFHKYDDSKWTIKTPSNLLLDYIQKELLPFPKSIHFNTSSKKELLIYCKNMHAVTNKMKNRNQKTEKTEKIKKATFFNILSDISGQMFYYEKNNYTFIGFDLDDIIEIEMLNEKSRYIIMSEQYLCKIHPYNKKETQLTYLLNSPCFCSSEITLKVANNNFPTTLHAKSGYYGFGKYMEHIYQCTINNGKKINNTKIAGFLRRCFDPDEDAKQLLYI